MRTKILTALFVALATFSLSAQTPAPAPSPQPTPPPYLDGPDHWDIHGPNGDIDFDIAAEFWFNDGFCDVYFLDITGTVDGQPYHQIGIAMDCGDGTILDVWSGDSGNWVEWHWQGDHYKKVGGTSHVRTYHPAD